MKKLRLWLCFLILVVLLAGSAQLVSAQTYLFTLPAYEVEAYLESDGSLTLYYYMEFLNDPSASPLDFVDLALPYGNYNLKNLSATINEQPMPHVANSAYVHGAELGLEQYSIQPGELGIVKATITGITDILFPYDSGDRDNYANFQFTPNYFGSEFDRSKNTSYRVTIILPPGVSTTDGVYYTPSGWPGDPTPEASTTMDNRVYYSWFTENADVHSQYLFGTAFPATVVPSELISTKDEYTEYENQPSIGSSSGFFQGLLGALPCLVFLSFFVGISIFVVSKSKKSINSRKLQYLPPKISIEGQGIKRGLTAVEAGILLEQSLDKVLTMILFALIKKSAITVTNRDPLTIVASEPLPEDLHPYELEFVTAFSKENKNAQRKALQSMMINLVKTVSDKMKGFSQKETVEYYKDIVNRAWIAVEEAQTPEIKSAQYDHTLEWTMLDKEFDDKTQRTFTGTPVFIPRWWPRYDPLYQPRPVGGNVPIPVSTSVSPTAGGSRPSVNLPNIPGADFAASILNGSSAMAAGVIGDLTGFTSGVTNRTNPIPVQTSSSGKGGFRGGGGGGHSCACACACAGCACACAGGGR